MSEGMTIKTYSIKNLKKSLQLKAFLQKGKQMYKNIFRSILHLINSQNVQLIKKGT